MSGILLRTERGRLIFSAVFSLLGRLQGGYSVKHTVCRVYKTNQVSGLECLNCHVEEHLCSTYYMYLFFLRGAQKQLFEHLLSASLAGHAFSASQLLGSMFKTLVSFATCWSRCPKHEVYQLMCWRDFWIGRSLTCVSAREHFLE